MVSHPLESSKMETKEKKLTVPLIGQVKVHHPEKTNVRRHPTIERAVDVARRR